MAELDFVTLDVFTTTPYKGNPLAVVHLPPNGDGALSYAQKLAIAAEFNLSETVFVHDAAAAAAEGLDPLTTRRIDIFMTVKELPFAGHPTIGSAKYLQSQGITQLVTKAGPIPIRFGGDGIASASIPHDTHLNSLRLADIESRLDAFRLHLSPEIRAAELAAPIFSIVRGMTFALIRLPSLGHLAEVAPGAFPIAYGDIMDAGWDDTLICRYYNVLIGTEVSDAGVRTVRLRTRMLETTIEDPATGSAACALTSYLALHEYAEQKIHFEVTQGVEMGRQSDIVVDITLSEGSDGARKIKEVLLGGTARQIMKGKITVPPA